MNSRWPHLCLLATVLSMCGCNETKDDILTTSDSAYTTTETGLTTTDTGSTTTNNSDTVVNDVTINVLWGELRDVTAVGTLWLAVYPALPDVPASKLTTEPLMTTSIDINNELAAPGSELASHRFESLPVTTELYYLNAFLDVNANASLPIPVPDTGDVWARGGVSGYPGFSAAAKNAEANVTLSFVIP